MARVCAECGKKIGWNDSVISHGASDYHHRCRPDPAPSEPVLVPCRACGKQISSAAPSCPDCGNPNQASVGVTQSSIAAQQSKKTGVGTVATGVFGGILGCLVAPLILGAILLALLLLLAL